MYPMDATHTLNPDGGCGRRGCFDSCPGCETSYGILPSIHSGERIAPFGMWVISENGTPRVEHGFFGSAAAASARIDKLIKQEGK